MQATEELAIAIPLLKERRDKLIIEAISRYKALDPTRKMTERDALLFVAALAENQQLQDDLLGVERQGRRDGAKLT